MSEDALWEAFVQESEDLLERFEVALMALDEQPHEPEWIAEAFRALHTLKGSGAMAGAQELSAFAHQVEAVFDRVRSHEMAVTPQLVNLSLAAKDHIRNLVTGTADPSTGAHLLQSFLGLAQQSPVAAELPTQTVHTYRLDLDFGPDALNAPLVGIFDELRAMGELQLEAVADVLPSLEDMDPSRLYLRWSGFLTGDFSEEILHGVFMFLDDDRGIRFERCQPESAGADPSPGPAGPSTRVESSGTQNPVVRVPVHKLDGLVDLVGELVIAKSRLEAVARRHPELVTIAEDVERLTEDLRERTMDLRMLPISSTFRRFQRLVRDLSGELGKPLVMETAGGDTELDKTVLDRLVDPLVHLIRNSADHGIEHPEERRAAGKPESGCIRLSARQIEGRVEVVVQDDGRGLNRDKIRRKAVDKGLISEEAELSDSEIYQLIFEAGFSTADSVSSISGRGVGMDVVKRSIADLNGSLDIRSTPGQGTTLTVRLPLSLAIMDGLLVQIGQDPYVFPLSLVEECVEPPARTGGGGPEHRLVEVRGQWVPYIELGAWFSAPNRDEVRDEQVVIMNLDMGRYGFLVDRVVGQHQTVIKDLGPLGRDITGLSGATILGDGAVALILDAQKIVGAQSRAPARA